MINDPNMTPDMPRRPIKSWPVNMTEATYISRFRYAVDAEIAAEYGLDGALIHHIRSGHYDGVWPVPPAPKA